MAGTLAAAPNVLAGGEKVASGPEHRGANLHANRTLTESVSQGTRKAETLCDKEPARGGWERVNGLIGR